MLPFEDRYSRQRRLAEVGADGQRAIVESHVQLAEHPNGELEREYLTRAGVSRFEVVGGAVPPAFPWSEQFQFAAARGIACGAWSALAQLRRILAHAPR